MMDRGSEYNSSALAATELLPHTYTPEKTEQPITEPLPEERADVLATIESVDQELHETIKLGELQVTQLLQDLQLSLPDTQILAAELEATSTLAELIAVSARAKAEAISGLIDGSSELNTPDDFVRLAEAHKLSESEIRALVKAAPPEKQAGFLAALGVAGYAEAAPKRAQVAETAFSSEETKAVFEEKQKLEQAEVERRVVETQENSHALRLAIEAAWPWRAEREQERARIEAELHGQIASAGELSVKSRNSPLYLKFKERADGLPAVYKPRKRDVAGLRDGIPGDGYTMREWLAGQIDRALQIDVIPTTIVRDGPEGFGAVQDWKIGKMACLSSDWQKEGNAKGLRDVAFNDIVKANSDRHVGNFLIAPDGQVHGIDHGLIFPDLEKAYLLSEPAQALAGQEVPADIVKRIADFREAPEVQEVLKKAFVMALGQEAADRAWARFLRGVDSLSPQDGSKGVFRGQGWHK